MYWGLGFQLYFFEGGRYSTYNSCFKGKVKIAQNYTSKEMLR